MNPHADLLLEMIETLENFERQLDRMATSNRDQTMKSRQPIKNNPDQITPQEMRAVMASFAP